MAAKPTILVHLAAALSLVDVGSIRSRGITPVHVARIYASTAYAERRRHVFALSVLVSSHAVGISFISQY